MSARDLDLIPAGTVFTPAEIIHYADPDMRDLAQAVSEADLLVTVPHGGSGIPEELLGALPNDLTRRLQLDRSDAASAAVVRRWAEIDPRIVAVINPHSPIVGDADGPAAADLSAHAHGEVAERGLGVYEATRDELTELFLSTALVTGGSFTRLAIRDSMHVALGADGAIASGTEADHEIPSVIALSIGGDAANGEPSPRTMRPEQMERLADAYRAEFEVPEPDAVRVNPADSDLGEIAGAAARFAAAQAEAEHAGLALAAVHAEFSREYLIGPEAVAQLAAPGTDWVDEDRERIDIIAYACKRAWDAFRAGV